MIHFSSYRKPAIFAGAAKSKGSERERERDIRTVEEVLGEGVVGHVLGDEEALVALGAASYQVHQSLMPHLAYSGRLRLPPKLFPAIRNLQEGSI